MNLTRNTLLADEAALANSFGSRLKGLLGIKHLKAGAGLHIVPCTSVHTFFMSIDIDVLFLDKELKVVDLVHTMPPWRMSRFYGSAASVLELPAGTAKAAKTEPGDALSFSVAKAL